MGLVGNEVRGGERGGGWVGSKGGGKGGIVGCAAWRGFVGAGYCGLDGRDGADLWLGV